MAQMAYFLALIAIYFAGAVAASQRQSRARPLAMIPFDTQRTKMGELRRQVFDEREEDFDEDDDLFAEDDYDDDDDYEYEDLDDDVPAPRKSAVAPAAKVAASTATSAAAVKATQVTKGVSGSWNFKKFSDMIELRLGGKVGKPVYWAAEGKLTHPASGQTLARVVGVEKHTLVRKDKAASASSPTSKWLSQLGFTSDAVLNRPSAPPPAPKEDLAAVATSITHRTYAYVDPKTGKRLLSFKPKPRSKPTPVPPVVTYSSVMNYALSRSGRLAVVSENTQGRIATAEDTADASAIQSKSFLSGLNPFAKSQVELKFFAHPSADKDATTVFDAPVPATPKPPLVGFGRKKPAKAPGVQEQISITSSSSETRCKYSRWGECPSWANMPGQTCALEMDYRRSTKWDKVPEVIRRFVGGRVADFPETPFGMQTLLNIKRDDSSKGGWFGKK